MKKLAAICLALLCVWIPLFSVCAANTPEDTAEYLIQTVKEPKVSSVGGEWTIIGLARAQSAVPNGYFDGYYSRLCARLKEKDGVLHARKNTEYARVTLALRAIGKNPESVDGYNLIKPLTDVEKTASQGLNGTIWALIALDCGDYGNDTVREQYLSLLLNSEKSGGGFSLTQKEEEPDVDITAMALTALAPYRDRDDVKPVIDRALSVLSALQNEDGTFTAYGTESSESIAQVLTALSSLGISDSDRRFCPSGKSLSDVLLSYRCDDGSFRHTDTSNLMATEQAFYALCAVERQKNGKPALFDMNEKSKVHADVKIPQAVYARKSFSDVAAYKTEIEELSTRGIVNGVGNGLFAPNRTVSRSEFCAITVRALGLTQKSDKHFDDVSPNVWYESAVQTAYRYGIVNGVSDTHFAPDGKINLEQACVMLAGMSALCGEPNEQNAEYAETILNGFSDRNNVSDWAKSDVAFCIEKGVFVRKGKLSAKTALTRGELTAAVYRILKGANLI